jgi:hypothetical protein
MQIRQPNTLERETRSSLVDIFDAHHAGPLVIGDQQFNDLVQKFFLSKGKSEIFERIVKPMIKRNLYESEGMSAGAAEVFLRLCVMHFDHEGRNTLSKIDWDKALQHIAKLTKVRPTRSEIYSLIDNRSTQDVSELLKNALDMSSRDDIIEVVRAYDVKTSITTEMGSTFNDVKIDPCYYAAKPWSKQQVNVILVDGIIEKSIHVEHILQKSNIDKEPYMIICREATEEVKNVCNTNFLRQTTDVVLCTAPYSEKTAHIFEDLKVITECDVISPEMGDIITAHIYKKASKIKKVSVTHGNLIIENKNQDNVKKHRDSLIEKMNQIIEIDTANQIARVQAGVINLDLDTAAKEFGLAYLPDPASRDWSSLGGNAATNAGGMCCVKYGVTGAHVRATYVHENEETSHKTASVATLNRIKSWCR